MGNKPYLTTIISSENLDSCLEDIQWLTGLAATAPLDEWDERRLTHAHVEAADEREVLTTAIRSYANRVALGVRFLNRTLPTWLKKIKISELELSNASNCVLGQLATKSAITSAGYDLRGDINYHGAVSVLKIDGFRYGFNYASDEDGEALDVDEDTGFYILNHLWTTAIHMSKRGEKVSGPALAKLMKVA